MWRLGSDANFGVSLKAHHHIFTRSFWISRLLSCSSHRVFLQGYYLPVVSKTNSGKTQRFLFIYLFFIFFLIFFNIYSFLRQRETEHEQGRGRERGRHRIPNRLQAPGSELSAQSPMQGSNSRTARSWPEPKSDAQLTEPPRHPELILIV